MTELLLNTIFVLVLGATAGANLGGAFWIWIRYRGELDAPGVRKRYFAYTVVSLLIPIYFLVRFVLSIVAVVRAV